MRFERCRMLFGEDFAKIEQANILILGVGGVGSYCLDCLYRSGVKQITIVDKDRFEITNQNRQIGSDALGELKVQTLAKRYPGVTPIETTIDALWIEQFDFEPFDIVLDCIDDIPAKVEIAKKVWQKLIVSCGSGKKIETTQIQVSNIWKVEGDKFCRKYKEALKKQRFSKRILAVHSKETPKCIELGSFVGVTGAFGLSMCSEAIKKIIGKE